MPLDFVVCLIGSFSGVILLNFDSWFVWHSFRCLSFVRRFAYVWILRVRHILWLLPAFHSFFIVDFWPYLFYLYERFVIFHHEYLICSMRFGDIWRWLCFANLFTLEMFDSILSWIWIRRVTFVGGDERRSLRSWEEIYFYPGGRSLGARR